MRIKNLARLFPPKLVSLCGHVNFSIMEIKQDASSSYSTDGLLRACSSLLSLGIKAKLLQPLYVNLIQTVLVQFCNS
jgi:hypothetical protein